MNLSILKTVTKPNHIRPILSTIRVSGGQAIATDLETTVIVPTTLQDGLYNTDGHKIQSVLIKGEAVNVSLDEFPTIATPNDLILNGTYDVKSLYNILNINKNFIGPKENLAVHCVRFAGEDIVATNTYSLCLHKSSSSQSPVSIPQSTLKALIKVLKEVKQGEVKMYINDNKNLITFDAGEYTIISRCVDLAFPDYKNIISNLYNITYAKVNRKELVKILKDHKKVNVKDDTAKYKSVFTIAAGNMKVTSCNPALTITDELDCEANNEMQIALNTKFIYDFISKLKCDTIKFTFMNHKSAVEIIPEGEDGYLLVMPFMQ